MFLQDQISFPFSIYKVFTGSNQSPLFRFTRFLQGQISLPFSICIVFTGSNQSPFLNLQEFYRIKSLSLLRFTMLLHGQIGLSFRFTRLLQGQIGLSFSLYKVFTGSNQSPFFDLQCFYRVKSVSLFRFSVFLQCEMIPSLFDVQGFYIIFTRS